jgi:hypothetical protein
VKRIYPRQDSNDHPKIQEKQEIPAQDGTDSGTVADAGTLDRLAAALRNLSPADRAQLAAMLTAGQEQAEGKGGMPGTLSGPSASSQPQGPVNAILCDPAPVCGVILDGSSNSGREAPKT